LPRLHRDLVLTRAQFEELVQPVLAGTLDGLADALLAAEVDARDLDAVVLTGGAARTPLVGALVGAAVPGRVWAPEDPWASAAKGAAAAARLVPAAAQPPA